MTEVKGKLDQGGAPFEGAQRCCADLCCSPAMQFAVHSRSKHCQSHQIDTPERHDAPWLPTRYMT